MLAKEVMSKKPEFLPPTATVKEAANQMRKHDYGFVLIGENDRLKGTVTDRDIAVRVIGENKDPNKTSLQEIMSEGIHYCYENDPIETAIEQMKKFKIRRLVVLNTDKRMTGVISMGDIATKCQNAKLCSELVEAVSKH